MRPFAVILLVCLGLACRARPTTPVAEGDPTLDGRGCTALDLCQCQQRPDCQPITESCSCPYPACGSGSCFCGGGRFWGCAPAASVCTHTVDCPGKAAARADERGCFSCGR
jgi:hypothetical protein